MVTRPSSSTAESTNCFHNAVFPREMQEIPTLHVWVSSDFR